MRNVYQDIHHSFQLTAIMAFVGILSGCTVGQCVSWDERPITRNLCRTGSTHDGCGVSHATNTYTTFEKICTARLAPDADMREAVDKAADP